MPAPATSAECRAVLSMSICVEGHEKRSAPVSSVMVRFAEPARPSAACLCLESDLEQ